VESIRHGITQRRNPVLAALLARAMRRESRGVGIPTMFRMLRERGLPEPDIAVEGAHFRLTLPFGERRLA
jgi:predicted HTH transcriptional regulator